MRSLFPITIILFALTSCVTTRPSHLEFKSSAEAESYLREHKACPGCNLYQAELANSDLKAANLENANLKGADLNSTDLRAANLRGAILVRADLSWNTQLEGADLSFADLTEANISPSQLKLAKTFCATFPNGKRQLNCKYERDSADAK